MRRPIFLSVLIAAGACHPAPAALLDGGSDQSSSTNEAGVDAAAALDPVSVGPSAVGTSTGELVDAKYGKFTLYLYYPATSAGEGAPADRARGPFPVVVFAHGHGGSGGVNTWIGKHLASRGYLCIFFNAPDPSSFDTEQWVAGIHGAIQFVVDQSKGATAPLAGLVDGGRVGLIGHSQGGSAVLMAAAGGSNAIKAVVAMAPPAWSFEKDPLIKTAVQIQVGTLDGVCPPSASESHYEKLAAPKQLVEIAGGNHIGFLDAGLAYEAAKQMIAKGLLPDQAATLSRDEQERLSKKYLTAWIAYHVRGETTYAPYLFGAEAAKDRSSGLLTRLDSSPR